MKDEGIHQVSLLERVKILSNKDKGEILGTLAGFMDTVRSYKAIHNEKEIEDYSEYLSAILTVFTPIKTSSWLKQLISPNKVDKQ